MISDLQWCMFRQVHIKTKQWYSLGPTHAFYIHMFARICMMMRVTLSSTQVWDCLLCKHANCACARETKDATSCKKCNTAASLSETLPCVFFVSIMKGNATHLCSGQTHTYCGMNWTVYAHIDTWSYHCSVASLLRLYYTNLMQINSL